MTENYDLNSLLHPNVDLTKSTKSSLEYTPSADKGVNGVYKSIIRFIPWYKDPSKSYLEKWTSWLVDPITNRGRSIDCPSTVGKDSPLLNTYRKLKKSESITDQKKADIFSRKIQYAFLIQVIKDEQNKELEGKILVWRVGKKVWEKYEAEKKPVIGPSSEPFDLLDGKAFALIIQKVAGFNNYDQARFIDNKIPLLIPNEAGKLEPISEKTDPNKVFTFLKENSPDLSQYGYREWDNETWEYVNQVIIAATGQPSSSTNYASVRSNVNESQTSQHKTLTPQNSAFTIEDIGESDLSSEESYDIPDLNLDLNTGIDIPNDIGGLPGNLDEALNSI